MQKSALKRSKTTVGRTKLPSALPPKHRRTKKKSKHLKSARSFASIKSNRRQIPRISTALSERRLISHQEMSDRGQSRVTKLTERQAVLGDYYAFYSEDARNLRGAYLEASSGLNDSSELMIKTEDIPDLDFYTISNEPRTTSGILKSPLPNPDRRKLISIEMPQLHFPQPLPEHTSEDTTTAAKHQRPSTVSPIAPQPIHSRAYQFPQFFPNTQSSARFFRLKKKTAPQQHRVIPAVEGHSPYRSQLTERLEPMSYRHTKPFSKPPQANAASIMKIQNPRIALLLATELPEDTPECSLRDRVLAL